MTWNLYFTHTAKSKTAKISIPAEKGAETRVRIAAKCINQQGKHFNV